MKIETKILEIVSQMPEALKKELLHYTEYLFENYSQAEEVSTSLEESKKKRGGFGILKGKLWVSEDFDEPLEDFKEYMQE